MRDRGALSQGTRRDVGGRASRRAAGRPGRLPIAAQATGYLQHIAADGLLRFAEEHDAVLRLEQHPGEFVSPGTPLAFANRALDDAGIEALRALFAVGDFRTAEQDAGFGIRQIVDIAIKALSPGVNDVSTAVACLDYLGAILCHLASRRLTSPFRAEKGTLRVIALAPSFEHLVAKSLDEIRLSAAGDVTILRQVLRVLARVAAGTRDSSHREVLLTHARLAAELADHSIAASYDRARINAELVLSRAPLLASPSTLPALPIKRVHER